MDQSKLRKLAGLPMLTEALGTSPKVILIHHTGGTGNEGYEAARDILKLFGYKDFGYVQDLSGAEKAFASNTDKLQYSMWAAIKPTLADVQKAFNTKHHLILESATETLVSEEYVDKETKAARMKLIERIAKRYGVDFTDADGEAARKGMMAAYEAGVRDGEIGSK